MRWTAHVEGGPSRVNHAAVLIGDKIYSFGGFCSSEEYKDWDSIPVHVLNTFTLRWSAVDYDKSNSVPYQRYGHTAVSYGSKVYMWGGRNNSVAFDTLSCFDTESLTWSTPPVTGMVPFAKDGHSACVVKNKMYIFGGFEYLTDQYSQEVHCLDLDTLQWTFVNTTGTPPSYRDFHTSVAIDDKMYIYGGRGDLYSPYNSEEEIYCTDVFYLDIAEGRWVTAPTMGVTPTGRRSHSCWHYKKYMYMFGGYNDNIKKHFNDVWRFSVAENRWERLNIRGLAPSKRRRQACVPYRDRVYLFGGTSPAASSKSNESQNDDIEKLMDNSDLHILDYEPTLKTLCILAIYKYNLKYERLPHELMSEVSRYRAVDLAEAEGGSPSATHPQSHHTHHTKNGHLLDDDAE